MEALVIQFGRLALVYVHLIAVCVALGLVLKSDVMLVLDTWRGDHAASMLHMRSMDRLKNIVMVALGVLWITGGALVGMDAVIGGLGWFYFENPKIQTKILVVTALTLNGIALHNLVLPWLQQAGSLLELSWRRVTVAALTGAVSGVSWLYAAFFGIGRPLSWKYTLTELMVAYPVLIAGAFLATMALVTWCKTREHMRETVLS